MIGIVRSLHSQMVQTDLFQRFIFRFLLRLQNLFFSETSRQGCEERRERSEGQLSLSFGHLHMRIVRPNRLFQLFEDFGFIQAQCNSLSSQWLTIHPHV